MRIAIAALAVATIIAATNGASASYFLTPGATPEERERYDLHHTQINEFHTGQSPNATVRQSSSRFRSSRAPHMHSTSPEHDVHVSGRYVGSDPDPRVRDALRRDGGWINW